MASPPIDWSGGEPSRTADAADANAGFRGSGGFFAINPSGGGAARPELDPQRLSPMMQTLLTMLRYFRVLRILIILFPARPFTTERNDAQCPQERLRLTDAASQRAEILGPASLFSRTLCSRWI